MTSRALRALLLANDGASAGHVTRALAIGRALLAEGSRRGFAVQPLLVTTSAADALVAWAGIPAVRIPGPAGAARAGWSELSRRQVATRVLEGVVESFAPDVLVTDTFPAGPQLEARGILDAVRWRVLVRRRVRPDRARDAVAATGLERYPLVLVPDDPGPIEAGSPEAVPGARAVAPITLAGDEPALADPRRTLGLPEGKLLLISCGGGGDPEAEAVCARLARGVLAHGAFVPVIARGPLAAGAALAAGVATISPVPLQPCPRAFDAALCAAGYDSAHEAALAGLPLALFARAREFDDQAARARRFAAAGLAHVLEALDDRALAQALDRLADAPRAPALRRSGARDAAGAILDLVENAAQAVGAC